MFYQVLMTITQERLFKPAPSKIFSKSGKLQLLGGDCIASVSLPRLFRETPFMQPSIIRNRTIPPEVAGAGRN